MTKGDETRDAVLREALVQSSHVGLNGITIGGLAESVEMSKSGLFAHFRSKEQLQIEVLDFAAQQFRGLVVLPALGEARGEPRLRKLFERWLGWDGYADYALPGGCVFVGAASEFDDLPDGPVRTRLVHWHDLFLDAIATVIRSGIADGQFREDIDAEQLAHDLYAVMLGHHFAARLMREPGAADRAHAALDRLLEQIRR